MLMTIFRRALLAGSSVALDLAVELVGKVTVANLTEAQAQALGALLRNPTYREEVQAQPRDSIPAHL